MSAWFGLFGPKGLPPEVVRTLNERMQSVIEDAKVKQRLYEVGAEGVGGPQRRSPSAIAPISSCGDR